MPVWPAFLYNPKVLGQKQTHITLAPHKLSYSFRLLFRNLMAGKAATVATINGRVNPPQHFIFDTLSQLDF